MMCNAHSYDQTTMQRNLSMEIPDAGTHEEDTSNDMVVYLNVSLRGTGNAAATFQNDAKQCIGRSALGPVYLTFVLTTTVKETVENCCTQIYRCHFRIQRSVHMDNTAIMKTF